MGNIIRRFFRENNTNTISTLLLNDFIYSNPKVTSRYMKKDKYRRKPEKLLWLLIYNTTITTSLIVLFFYSFLFLKVDFSIMPFLIDYAILLFIVITILQTFPVYFNIFYESKDINWYKALPIKEETVYKSKMVAILLSTTPMLIPIVPAIAVFYYMNKSYVLGEEVAILVGVFIGLIYFTIINFLTISINILIMKLISRTALLSKFKNSFMNITYILGIVILIAGLLFFQIYKTNPYFQSVLGFRGGRLAIFAYSLLNPVWNSICMIVILFLSVLIYKFSTKNINGNYYLYIENMQNTILKNNKVKYKSDLNRKETKYKNDRFSSFCLLKYNIMILKESVIFNQSIISPALFFFIFLVALAKKFTSFNMDSELSTVIFIPLIAQIYLGVFPFNLSSIIFSVDGINFDYIKSLPINRRKYFLNKWIFSAILGNILPAIMMFVTIILFTKIKYYNVFLIELLFFIISIGISGLWAIYDYVNIFKDWQNIGNIYSRINKIFYLMSIVILIFLGYSLLKLLTHIQLPEYITFSNITLCLYAILSFCSIIVTLMFMKFKL